jgi:hypothetical protein
MKKRIFIGSSSEQLPTLNQIIALIGEEAECVSWTSAFGLNKSGLDALIKQTRLCDFSLLLATKDDVTTVRGEDQATPRDNVIFEFGLFLGASGVERCYLIAEEGADLPSDLNGITVAKFSREPDRYNSLDKVIENVVEHVKRASMMSELGLLPSTALAIGYYNSFIKRLCEELHRSDTITADGKQLKVKSFAVNVIIPDKLDQSGVSDFVFLYNKKHKLNKATTALDSAGRGYPFHFKIDPPQEDVEKEIDIHISDIPTTLSTIVECIKLYLPSGEVGADFNNEHLEKRELDNFASVLEYYISMNAISRGYVSIERNAVANL